MYKLIIPTKVLLFLVEILPKRILLVIIYYPTQYSRKHVTKHKFTYYMYIYTIVTGKKTVASLLVHIDQNADNGWLIISQQERQDDILRLLENFSQQNH